MIYLFLQTWLWILFAGLLGLFIGWLIWGRSSGELREQLHQSQGKVQRLESSAEAASLSASMDAGSEVGEPNARSAAAPTESETEGDDAEVEAIEVRDEWRPEPLDEPDGEGDDLKRIKGVGPVIQKTLNELGIYHFRQVAAFTEDNVKWVDNYIAFPGRIQREGWVAQAEDLAGGRSTDFSNRYDRGNGGKRG